MERRFIEAATTGDVEKLHSLMEDYPILLRSVALASGDTPLHFACIGGDANFVKEVLNLRPEFAEELNQDGLSPLHIASANGEIETVKELLELGSHLCLVQGKEQRIPFHFAVVKGRVQVIRELLSACSDSITEVTARGETCFHLAMKNNQFKAFKALCEHVVSHDKVDILNHKDEQGNTILHIAASRKQYEFVDLLFDKDFGYRGYLEVNSLNREGLTPLDVLASEGGDIEIEEMFTLAGAVTAAVSAQNSVVVTQGVLQIQSEQEQSRRRPKSAYQKLKDFLKYDVTKDTPGEARNTLLVIAVLIATATYQAGLSPPGGAWQDGVSDDGKSHSTTELVFYSLFLFFNSIGFLMSLEMMYFLTHGLPMILELRIALAALLATYFIFVLGATTTFTWMALIFLSIVMPAIVMIVTKIVRACFKKGRSHGLPIATGASA